MRNLLTTAAKIVASLVFADLAILTFALAQLAVEGRTGYWNPFWLWQARILIGLLS